MRLFNLVEHEHQSPISKYIIRRNYFMPLNTDTGVLRNFKRYNGITFTQIVDSMPPLSSTSFQSELLPSDHTVKRLG